MVSQKIRKGKGKMQASKKLVLEIIPFSKGLGPLLASMEMELHKEDRLSAYQFVKY